MIIPGEYFKLQLKQGTRFDLTDDSNSIGRQFIAIPHEGLKLFDTDTIERGRKWRSDRIDNAFVYFRLIQFSPLIAFPLQFSPGGQ